MSRARRIVEVVLHDLSGRKGFDWFWDDADDEIKAEIMSELTALVDRELQ